MVPTPAPSPSISLPIPSEPQPGSCPGDGICNGTGGGPSCRGCPSYNNSRRFASGEESGIQTPEESMSANEDVPEDQLTEDPEAPSFKGNLVSLTANGPVAKVAPMCCENCGTFTTPLWRRDGDGRVACNACGLYYKLHRKHRPVNMKRPVIKRRKRVTNAPATSTGQTPLKSYSPYPQQSSGRQQTSSARLSPSNLSPESPERKHKSSPKSQSPNSLSSNQQTTERRSPPNTLPQLAAVASAMLPLQGYPSSTSPDDKDKFREELEISIMRAEEESKRLNRFLQDGKELLRKLNGERRNVGDVQINTSGRNGNGSGSLWSTSSGMSWDSQVEMQI